MSVTRGGDDASPISSEPVTKPVAGKMYIALEDGRLVPVNTSLPFVMPSGEGIATSSHTVSHNQLVSISGIKVQSKEQPFKIVQSAKPVLKGVQQEIIISPSGKEQEKVTLIGKNQNDTEILMESEKNLISAQENKPEGCFEEDDDLLEESFVESAENECTTHEYIYDELSDGENNAVDANSEEADYSEIEAVNEEGEVIPEISLDDEEDLLEQSTPTEKLIQRSFTGSGVKRVKFVSSLESPSPSKRMLLLNTSTKTATSSPKLTVAPSTSPTKKRPEIKRISVTTKAPKINEKFPDLPVPANLNQYGDCLKTRLGRYHYGLTLTDPPSQFFQGVLKGASGQTLAAMFGDINLISKFDVIPLDEIGHFAIDTTFCVIPNSTTGVNHVMTISLLFNNQVIPLWYAIMSCSSTELYKRILIEFQQHVLDWPFTTVLLDNDPVLCKAVLALFPDSDLYGSWFYYCMSIWKELTLNNLAEKCRTEPTLLTAVKLLMVIPYLPPLSDVPSSLTMVEGFEVVRNFAEDNNLPKEFNKVLDFVAAFWFNRVKTKNFSVFGKQTSALNCVEISQLALLSYMKPDGNVWTLTHAFQSVAKTAYLEFNRFLNGKPLLAKKGRAKKYNVLIRQNMKKLLSGTYDVKTYLEKSTVYCDEMLDIFLHPLYPTVVPERISYNHTEGWKIKINTQ